MQLFDCKYICSHLTAQIYFDVFFELIRLKFSLGNAFYLLFYRTLLGITNSLIQSGVNHLTQVTGKAEQLRQCASSGKKDYWH